MTYELRVALKERVNEMQELDDLPETSDYTETCALGLCSHCDITREVSICKHCEADTFICNTCRPDHIFHKHMIKGT